MGRIVTIQNGMFTPTVHDRILFEIPVMACAKNRGRCPIEENPVLADYRLLPDRKDPADDLQESYCVALAKELVDAYRTRPADLEYDGKRDVFRCITQGQKLCVAQKLNAANEEKCSVRINLTIKI